MKIFKYLQFQYYNVDGFSFTQPIYIAYQSIGDEIKSKRAMILMSKEVLHTKFGIARIYLGYYKISSRKEGNHRKYLHKLIFEDFYGFKVPNGFVVHHKDGNKLNNCILNLQLMNAKEHSKLHNSGLNSPNFGKHHSKKTKKRMSDAQKGKAKSLEHRLNLSKAKSNTGYYRVGIWRNNRIKQGWCYRYQYKDENNKLQAICSVDIEKLKKKVIDKNLEWIEY